MLKSPSLVAFGTFPRRNKVFGPLKAMLFHPARALRVQAVVQGTGPQLTPSLEVPARNLQFIQQSWTQAQRRVTRKRRSEPPVRSTKLLTHDLHHSVSQEGSTALQVAEAFDVQRPHVSGGIAVRHPLCQIPEGQTELRVGPP